MSNFEEYRIFFVDTLTEEAVINMFLSNFCKALKIDAITIKRYKPSWDAFLREITRLDNEEPRAAVGAKPPYKKASLAMGVEEVRGGSPSKIKLAQEVSELKKRLAERGSTS